MTDTQRPTGRSGPALPLRRHPSRLLRPAGRRPPPSWPRAAVTSVREAFSAPLIEGLPWAKLSRALHVVRVAIGVAALASAGIVPVADDRQRMVFVALIGLVYLPYAVAILLVARRHSGIAVRMAGVAGDLLVVFAFQALVPATGTVALLGYLLILALHTTLGGLAAGGVVATTAIVLTVVAQPLAPPSQRIDTYTLAMYAVVAWSLLVVLATATRAQRRGGSRLVQLHASLRKVASAMELRETFDAVAEAARDALRAAFVAVYTLDGEELRIGAVRGQDYAAPVVAQLPKVTKPDTLGGSGIALRTGRPVVCEDVTRDPRFPSWVPVAHMIGVYAMIAVPVIVDGRPAGTLSAYFPAPRRITPEDIDLTQAFAEQAAVAYARAVALEQEREAAARLRELDRMRAQFVSTVSHELRTPLTCIEGFAQTMDLRWQDLSDAERRDFVRRILRNAHELHGLIERVLDHARLDAGWAEIRPRRIPLQEAVLQHVDARRPALGGARVVVDVPPGLEVEADPDAIDRIVGNLLSNAARFSPPGAVIRLEARVDGLDAVVSVTDQGVGIPAEEQERVFEPFFQGSRQAAGRKGAGFGLTVAQRYVELHGGRMWVRSEEGEGATFSFTLPLAYVAGRATA